MSSAFLAPVDITNSDAPSDRHCEIASNELVYCIFSKIFDISFSGERKHGSDDNLFETN